MSALLKPIVAFALLCLALGASALLVNQSRHRDHLALDNELRELQTQRLLQALDVRIEPTRRLLAFKARSAKLRAALSAETLDDELSDLSEASYEFGMSVIGLHLRSQNSLYLDKAPASPDNFYGLESLLTAAYAGGGRSLLYSGEFRGKPALMFAEPIRELGQVRGMLVAVRDLDPGFVDSLSRSLGLPVQIVINGQRMGVMSKGEPTAVRYATQGGPELQLEVRIPPVDATPSSASLLQPLTLALALGLLGVLLSALSLRYRQRREQALLAHIEALTERDSRANSISALQQFQENDGPGQLGRAVLRLCQQHEQALQTQLHNQTELESERSRLQNSVRELTRAREQSSSAPRLKSEFLSRMGEEIRTPMNNVVSMFGLLRSMPLDKEPKELTELGHRSATTLMESLTNILDFIKLDAGQLRLSEAPFLISHLVRDVVYTLRPQAMEKGLRLEYSMPDELPRTANGDVARVQQILSNLVSNAIRFTAEGEIGVYVDLLPGENSKYLRFSVVDTGLGIAKEAQASLFESLEERTRLANSSFAGRLRLIVAKELTNLMQGEIGVSSELNKGSRFWFTIKLSA